MNMQGVLSRAVGSVFGAHCLLSRALTSAIQASVGGQGQGKVSAHWQPLLLPQGPWEELWAGVQEASALRGSPSDDIGQ